mmetsp:Transcript_31532/g.62350  ORF Transcript_31532/g.62350 Transcript_31532/m.62350 type:complete len:105 (+) Transcript_31532:370-684(+)
MDGRDVSSKQGKKMERGREPYDRHTHAEGQCKRDLQADLCSNLFLPFRCYLLSSPLLSSERLYLCLHMDLCVCVRTGTGEGRGLPDCQFVCLLGGYLTTCKVLL